MTDEEVRVTSETGGQKQWRAPRPTHAVPVLDLAWVAGLVEGEGSFYLSSGRYPAPRFQLNMTDEDVVRAAHAVMGVGVVNPMPPGPRSVKPQWRWRVTSQAEVRWLMEKLRPFMGLRRGAKIDDLLERMPAWTTR